MTVIVKNAAGGGSGKAGTYIGGSKLSQDAINVDKYAQYKTIIKTAGGTDQPLFSCTVKKLELGSYTVMIRSKVSDITKTNTIINIKAKVNNTNGELLKEFNLKPNMYKENDKYKTLGFIVDLNSIKGSPLFLEATIPSSADGVTVTVDYILVTPTVTSITALGIKHRR